jgi:hypothetical protein
MTSATRAAMWTMGQMIEHALSFVHTTLSVHNYGSALFCPLQPKCSTVSIVIDMLTQQRSFVTSTPHTRYSLFLPSPFHPCFHLSKNFGPTHVLTRGLRSLYSKIVRLSSN